MTTEAEIGKILQQAAGIMKKAGGEIQIESMHVYNLGSRAKPVVVLRRGIYDAARSVGETVGTDYCKGQYKYFIHNGVEWQQYSREKRRR